MTSTRSFRAARLPAHAKRPSGLARPDRGKPEHLGRRNPDVDTASMAVPSFGEHAKGVATPPIPSMPLPSPPVHLGAAVDCWRHGH
jgi:hypothetical protein